MPNENEKNKKKNSMCHLLNQYHQRPEICTFCRIVSHTHTHRYVHTYSYIYTRTWTFLPGQLFSIKTNPSVNSVSIAQQLQSVEMANRRLTADIFIIILLRTTSTPPVISDFVYPLLTAYDLMSTKSAGTFR